MLGEEEGKGGKENICVKGRDGEWKEGHLSPGIKDTRQQEGRTPATRKEGHPPL